MPRLRLRRLLVPDDTPSRSSMALAIAREALVVTLAFAAGAGTFLAAVSHDPMRDQDWYGALGAGALMALAKMYPTGGGGHG